MSSFPQIHLFLTFHSFRPRDICSHPESNKLIYSKLWKYSKFVNLEIFVLSSSWRHLLYLYLKGKEPITPFLLFPRRVCLFQGTKFLSFSGEKQGKQVSPYLRGFSPTVQFPVCVGWQLSGSHSIIPRRGGIRTKRNSVIIVISSPCLRNPVPIFRILWINKDIKNWSVVISYIGHT